MQSSGADGTTSAAVMYNMIRGSFCPDELAAAGSMNSMLGNVTGRDYPLRFAYDKDGSLIVTGEYGSAKVVGKELGCQSVVLLTDVPLIPPLEARGTAAVATLPTLPIRHLFCKPPTNKTTSETSPPSSDGTTTDDPSSSNNNALAIGLGVSLGCAAVVAVGMAFFILRRRRIRQAPTYKSVADPEVADSVPQGINGSKASRNGTASSIASSWGLAPATAVLDSFNSSQHTGNEPNVSAIEIQHVMRVNSGHSLLANGDTIHYTARIEPIPTATANNGEAFDSKGTNNYKRRSSEGTGTSKLGSRQTTATTELSTQMSRLVSQESASSLWEIDPYDVEIVLDSFGQPAVLGKGSFGAVYAGLLRGVQSAAIKVLTASAGSDGEIEFHREAAILKHINRDRNIVQLYGTSKLPDGKLLLLTELMEGGDLRRALDDPQKQESLAWHRNGKNIALDIARGLTAMHAVNVIHRDLKSKNVLLSKDFSAKIGDVGIAAVHSQGYLTASAGQVIGTLAWSAPELLMNGRCTEKVDIYSFGICLWELATGKMPERGFILLPEPSETCPAELISLINDCLRFDPEERPNAKEVYDRISKIPPLDSNQLESIEQIMSKQNKAQEK